MSPNVLPATRLRSRWAAAGLVLALGAFFSLAWVGPASATGDQSKAKLALVKSAEQGGTPIDASTDLAIGDTFTYVITATNQASSTIRDLVITDDLPHSVTPAGQVSVTVGGSTTKQDASTPVVVTVASLASGATVTIRIPVTITVKYPECMKINNKATAEFTYSYAETPGSAKSNKVTLSVGCGPSPSPSGSVTPTPTPSDSVTPTPTPSDSVTPTPTPSDSTGTGSLLITKSNDPEDVIDFGDTITYTLHVAVPQGSTAQTNVVVTDTIPGYDPNRPTSGVTTYVPASAECAPPIPAGGTCAISLGKSGDVVTSVTWQIGTLEPGTSRDVSFAVTADDQDPVVAGSETVDFLNVAAVSSDDIDRVESNEVKNTAVTTGVAAEEVDDDGELAATGPTTPVSGLGLAALVMIALGTALLRRTALQPYHGRHTR